MTTKYTSNNLKQKKLNNNIAAFIVNDLQSFSVLEEPSFKKIIEGLDPQINMPSKDRLKEILINAEDKILRNVHEYVLDDAEISYASFTTDMWTSNNDDPYIGDFQMKEMVGEISCFPYPHTAERLASKIIEILHNLNLKNKIICRTVDNGSNIKSCLQRLEQRHVLRSYEAKELSSNEWEMVTELIELLRPYEVASKWLSDQVEEQRIAYYNKRRTHYYCYCYTPQQLDKLYKLEEKLAYTACYKTYYEALNLKNPRS
ncbi:9598_t:CDS:2 [Racocetra fulgida]|uniref:9598_t:CDS:1 n=1 Tax=Racocetra fulgida TaxID=60492 RepID=A0A9N9ASL9_9GLOM|nr:9598_t:CDS:2 [Racocetra fulgida]